jgi:hypothetical protein
MLEKRVGPVSLQNGLLNNKKFMGTLREFMELKLNWPFKPKPDPGPCNYFFKDKHRRPPRNVVDDHADRPAAFFRLFHELSSRFRNETERKQAESLIDGLLEKTASAIR